MPPPRRHPSQARVLQRFTSYSARAGFSELALKPVARAVCTSSFRRFRERSKFLTFHSLTNDGRPLLPWFHCEHCGEAGKLSLAACEFTVVAANLLNAINLV